MLETWTSTTFQTLGLIALSAVGMYVAVLLLTRIAGLRSFAEMSAFDFAMSVAVGTLFASTIVSGDISLAEGAFALAMLFALQVLVAHGRIGSDRFSRAVDNSPTLIARDGEIFHDALTDARLTEEDLFAKLREANVRNLGEVIAVVLETTGDVSVIHTSGEEVEFDEVLLTGVSRP